MAFPFLPVAIAFKVVDYIISNDKRTKAEARAKAAETRAFVFGILLLAAVGAIAWLLIACRL